MEQFKAALDFLSNISWQLVAVFALIFLRTEIRQAFARLKGAKLPGKTELIFGDLSEPDLKIDESPSKVDGATGKWDKIANLYWLGSDISWTINIVMIGDGKKRILHGLTQTIHHLEQVDLGENRIKDQLKRLNKKVQDALESDLTPENRRLLTKDLNSIKLEIGHYIAAAQKDFVPYAKK